MNQKDQDILVAAMSLPRDRRETLAYCMLVSAENEKAYSPTKEEHNLPVLPPAPGPRLLQAARMSMGKKRFPPGRPPTGQLSIQDYVVLVLKQPENSGGLSRSEIGTLVSKESGCTYKQAYNAVAATVGKKRTLYSDGVFYLPGTAKKK